MSIAATDARRYKLYIENCETEITRQSPAVDWSRLSGSCIVCIFFSKRLELRRRRCCPLSCLWSCWSRWSPLSVSFPALRGIYLLSRLEWWPVCRAPSFAAVCRWQRRVPETSIAIGSVVFVRLIASVVLSIWSVPFRDSCVVSSPSPGPALCRAPSSDPPFVWPGSAIGPSSIRAYRPTEI